MEKIEEMKMITVIEQRVNNVKERRVDITKEEERETEIIEREGKK